MEEKEIYEILRKEIARKFGHNIESPTDHNALSADIKDVTGDVLSVSTIKRFFCYAGTEAVPRKSTLSIFSRYIGYSGYSDFLKSLDQRTPSPQSPALPQPTTVTQKRKFNTATLVAFAAVLLLAGGILCYLVYDKKPLSDTELYNKVEAQYDQKTIDQMVSAMAEFDAKRDTIDVQIQHWMDNRNKFIQDFPIDRLANMPRSAYDISNEEGFCYRMKHDFDLGDIDSAPYELKGASDNEYKAFMQNIVKLLRDAAAGNEKAVYANKMYSPLKYNMLSIYYPNGPFIPVFMDEQVDHFLNVFLPDPDVRKLLTPSDCSDNREILARYKSMHPIMRLWSMLEFEHFLFHFYPRSKQFYEAHHGIVNHYYNHPDKYFSK